LSITIFRASKRRKRRNEWLRIKLNARLTARGTYALAFQFMIFATYMIQSSSKVFFTSTSLELTLFTLKDTVVSQIQEYFESIKIKSGLLPALKILWSLSIFLLLILLQRWDSKFKTFDQKPTKKNNFWIHWTTTSLRYFTLKKKLRSLWSMSEQNWKGLPKKTQALFSTEVYHLKRIKRNKTIRSL